MSGAVAGALVAGGLGVAGAAATGLITGTALTFGSLALGGALGIAGAAAKDIIDPVKTAKASPVPASTLTAQQAQSNDLGTGGTTQKAAAAAAQATGGTGAVAEGNGLEGGGAASPLVPDQVKQRNTLFGN